MKPVTEDQVQSLLNGLEQREKEALRALAVEAETLPISGGKMTAKVLQFAGGTEREHASTGMDRTEIVPLGAHRAKRRRRITSRGLFYYVAGERTPKPSA